MSDTSQTPAITLYWGSGSSYAWRALLGLTLKGLAYESRLLEFSKGEHKTPQMLALNPRGKVPVLVDGDTVVYESLAVLAYLDRQYPEPALFGRTPAEAATVWRLVSEHEAYLEQPGRRVIRPLFFGKAGDDPDDLRAAAELLHTELGRLEAALDGRGWLAGDEVSAADIYYWVSLQQLLRAVGKPQAAEFQLGLSPLAERYPRIAAWSERFGALPGVDGTWPPHWT